MMNLAYPMLYITRKEKGDTQRKVAQKLGNKSTTVPAQEVGRLIQT